MTAVSVSVDQRSWRYPTAAERLTWDEMYAKVRSASGMYSEALLPQYRLVEAVDREIERLWPMTHVEEVWSASLTGYIDLVELPWQPEIVIDVSWRTDDNTTYGETINPGLWQVWEDQWRWLPPESSWPTGTIQWRMRAIGRPRVSTVETVYCTVVPEMLLPLVQIELDRLVALERGGEPLDVNARAAALRAATVPLLPKRRLPPRIPRSAIINQSTVIWKNWGATDITFADLA
jgi:hypothetical protein